MMKPYAFHSLFCAMMHNKYGIPGLEDALGFAPIGDFAVDAEKALNGLIALAFAHETKDIEGEFSEYVWGCMAGTNREPRRKARIKSICLALRGELL